MVDSPTTPKDLKTLFSQYNICRRARSQALDKAAEILADYLGGAWTDVTSDQLALRPVSGGLYNQLFLAKLPDGLTPIGNEPSCALIRIQSETDYNILHNENLIFHILSERSVSPRLYGVFHGGRLEQFIPSRPLLFTEIIQPKYTRLNGKKLVHFHALEVPIIKSPVFMAQAKGWIEKLRDKGDIVQLYATEAHLKPGDFPETITVDDFLREYEFVEEFLRKSGSPVVFCHNDLWERNILLRGGCTVNEDGTSPDPDPLVFVDYECCAYNYRGFDLGQYFCSMAMDFDTDKPYVFHMNMYENVELRKTFVNAYLDEAYRLRHRPNFPRNLVTGHREEDYQRLMEETYSFMPVTNFWYGAWTIYYAGIRVESSEEEKKNFDYAAYGRDRLVMYYKQKKYMEEYLKKLEVQ